MANREVLEGKQIQGVDEEITWTVTVDTTWGVPVAPLTVRAFGVDESTNTHTDVTSTVMPVGSGSINGQTITCPELKSLTQDILYRVEVKFATGTDIKEAYFFVRAER
jgi:hypothetical protein